MASRVLEAQNVSDLITQRGGQVTFQELMAALQAAGLDESHSRELIWQALALGLIEFTDDRSSLRILPDEGKVA